LVSDLLPKSDLPRGKEATAAHFPVTKVCFISPYPPQKGGISEYSKSLAEELGRHMKVTVFAQKIEAPAGEVDSPNVFVKRIWKPNSILAPLKLFKETIKESPDVVHLQYESYGLYGILDFLTTPILIILLRFACRKEVITLHSFLILPSERTQDRDYITSGSSGKFIKYAYQVLRTTVKLSLRFASTIIVHSDFIAMRIAQAISRDYRIAVIPIGSATSDNTYSKEEARRRLGFIASKMILFFGFISASKNIHELIDASQEVLNKDPDALVVIAGIPAEFDPNGRRYLDDLRKRADWTRRIVFVDRFVDTNEMDLLFAAADVVVLTYSIVQGSSATLSTALGYGVPVIVPEGGIAAKDVGLNEVGLTYKRGDVGCLADRITSILSNEQLRGELAVNAKRAARTRSWNVVARETMRVYCAEDGRKTA